MALSVSQSQSEDQCLLSPETKVFKLFPPSIINSIETNRRQQYLSVSSYSASNFLSHQRSLSDKIDDETVLNNINHNRHSPTLSSCTESSSVLRLAYIRIMI